MFLNLFNQITVLVWPNIWVSNTQGSGTGCVVTDTIVSCETSVPQGVLGALEGGGMLLSSLLPV